MKTRFYLFVFLFSFFHSCSGKKADDRNKIIEHPHTSSNQRPSSGFTDTIKINSTAAVFYSPDSIQWKSIKALNDSIIFESMQHDCYYQIRNAKNVLRSNYGNVKIIEPKNVRYLSFIMINNNTHCIDLDSLNDPCGIFLFTPKKKPLITDMTNIETEIGFYFKQ